MKEGCREKLKEKTELTIAARLAAEGRARDRYLT